MSGISRLRVQGGFDNGADLSLRDLGKTTRTRSVFLQTSQTESQKALPPELNGGSGSPYVSSNLLVQDSVSCQLDDPGSLHQAQRQASSLGPAIQRFTFIRGQINGLGDSHAGESRGNFIISQYINGTLH